jgi:ATP-dependent RNA helicase RhlE
LDFEQFSFDPRIRAGIKATGFTTPTPIQQQALPAVLKGHDVLGVAQTGTGKTAAFVLPILQRLTQGPRGRVRALIVAPTRELAEQIHEATLGLGRRMRVRSVTVYGGVSKNRQVEALRRGAEIVVACPGRLLDLAGDRSIDLSHVEVLVLDEADRMCDMGFLPDIRRILKLVPTHRQTLFFSATMPEDIRELADSILKNPTTVQVGVIAPVKTVSHALYPVSQGLKKQLLLATPEQTATGRVLIFTRTKYRARNLARDLEKHRYRVSALQGNMSQSRRQQAIDGFRDGRYDILVATDIASRGIDVSEISHLDDYRRILRHQLAGHSQEETARMLGWSRDATRGQFRRLVAKLAQHYSVAGNWQAVSAKLKQDRHWDEALLCIAGKPPGVRTVTYNVQILRLLLRGYDMAAIAVELGKSESAIKDARKKLKAKLVAYCQEQGIEPPAYNRNGGGWRPAHHYGEFRGRPAKAA